MTYEYVLCINNAGHEASLEAFKIYRAVPAAPLEESRGLIRVIDESGEDYLYPAKHFVANPVSPKVNKILAGRFRSMARQKVAA
jgi:hypothetical protein